MGCSRSDKRVTGCQSESHLLTPAHLALSNFSYNITGHSVFSLRHIKFIVYSNLSLNIKYAPVLLFLQQNLFLLRVITLYQGSFNDNCVNLVYNIDCGLWLQVLFGYQFTPTPFAAIFFIAYPKETGVTVQSNFLSFHGVFLMRTAYSP